MQGVSRKVFQAVLYETVAVFCISPAISLIYKVSLGYSGTLAVMISVIALMWNMVYNTAWEYWESRRCRRARTTLRRVLHSTGFEGGLAFILLPLEAYWLHISWWEALMVDIALFVFFFGYSFVFQWLFDRVFDVPDSAKDVA